VYGSYRQHWIFWVGPLIGAALAACFYEIFLKETAEVVTENEQ
jgi:glycerol uptake facilitator-like aquaporin